MKYKKYYCLGILKLKLRINSSICGGSWSDAGQLLWPCMGHSIEWHDRWGNDEGYVLKLNPIHDNW